MTTLTLPLDPMLVEINTKLNNAGIQKDDKLWFYTSPVAYKLSVHDYFYFMTQVSNKQNPCWPTEWIPLLESSGEAQVLAILEPQQPFLTPDQVAVQWANFGKDIELSNVSAG